MNQRRKFVFALGAAAPLPLRSIAQPARVLSLMSLELAGKRIEVLKKFVPGL
jgi:hypothetical protein